MSHLRPTRCVAPGWKVSGAWAAVLLSLLVTASPARADPVEDLRQALGAFELGQEFNQTALNYREETLKKYVAALKTLGDLRRALALTEWKDGPGSPVNVQRIDHRARAEVADRFAKGTQAIVAHGGATSRLAVARMLADMGVSVRALLRKEKTLDLDKKEIEVLVPDRHGFARGLTPQMVQLTRDQHPAVRAAAARALGKTNPNPDQAATALRKLLEGDGVEQRRAAAAALLEMVQVVARLQKRGQAQTGVEAFPGDVIEISKEVVPAAGVALRDPDVGVRRTALAALRQAATTFGELVPEPIDPAKFPPPGRAWTQQELTNRRKEAGKVEADEKLFAPLVTALASQGQGLANLLGDPDTQVRLEARRALEMLGNARLRLRRYATSVPEPPGAAVNQVAQKEKADPLGKALRPAAAKVAQSLGDPSVAVRRAAVEFLETLAEDARPAVGALSQALADPDRFVRWAAARTLGRVGPHRTDLSVPRLAHLVGDPDLDVSKEAADTLAGYGAEARAAVPALARATAVGDAEMRVKAIATLGTLGPEVAASSVPALITALANPDARVRREAAKSLGRFGAAARPAVDALRRALNDEDPEVRGAASDAVLSILPTGKE
jgi:HEAT repeat protein